MISYNLRNPLFFYVSIRKGMTVLLFSIKSYIEEVLTDFIFYKLKKQRIKIFDDLKYVMYLFP